MQYDSDDNTKRLLVGIVRRDQWYGLGGNNNQFSFPEDDILKNQNQEALSQIHIVYQKTCDRKNVIIHQQDAKSLKSYIQQNDGKEIKKEQVKFRQIKVAPLIRDQKGIQVSGLEDNIALRSNRKHIESQIKQNDREEIIKSSKNRIALVYLSKIKPLKFPIKLSTKNKMLQGGQLRLLNKAKTKLIYFQIIKDQYKNSSQQSYQFLIDSLSRQYSVNCTQVILFTSQSQQPLLYIYIYVANTKSINRSKCIILIERIKGHSVFAYYIIWIHFFIQQ